MLVLVVIDCMETKIRKPISMDTLVKAEEEIHPLAEVFNQMPDHIVITDENGNIVYANKAAEKHTGFRLAEITGKNPGDLWGGKMPKDFYQKMWYRIKIEKEPFVGEVLNMTKGGIPYYQELRVSPILDSGGEVKYFIGIEPDITHKKLLEQSREKFVEIFSRRLQNTFASSRQTMDWLSIAGKLNHKQQEKLRAIYANQQNLSILVSDLLNYIVNKEIK